MIQASSFQCQPALAKIQTAPSPLTNWKSDLWLWSLVNNVCYPCPCFYRKKVTDFCIINYLTDRSDKAYCPMAYSQFSLSCLGEWGHHFRQLLHLGYEGFSISSLTLSSPLIPISRYIHMYTASHRMTQLFMSMYTRSH